MSREDVKGQPDLPTPKTILVVDDNEEVRRIVVHTLRRAGHAVLESSDGTKGIEVANESGGPIDLLIADVQMPQMDGRMLANNLLAVHPGIKVLLVSGADLSLEKLESGVEFLEKPFTPKSLVSRVQAMLRNK
jgi:two-component system, cell cycle sensor histidine kinase and response regulator CckA